MSAEKTLIKGLSFCGNEPFAGANASAIDVEDGRIIRIRPFRFNWKYQPEVMNPWNITVRGMTLEPGMKTLISPLSLAYKKRVYSPNRIQYPLKRVDWNPDGERNPENRGKSKFQRISWDEATDIIIKELDRVRGKYGPCAILTMSPIHGETKVLHFAHKTSTRLLHHYLGDYSKIGGGGPDSWPGWFWGAKHVWGMTSNVGMMVPLTNCFQDMAEHTKMILFWGCDPETTPLAWGGQLASLVCRWWTELGIKSVYVCPDLNYGAAIHADKWIPILPNTDAALHLAISYVWISEGTYDKEYIKGHTYGFTEYKKYVMGENDGLPKTPEWASSICGIPEWTIKALAREWAANTTSIAHGDGGSMIRGPYSHEPARLEVLNLAMRGVGKPGCHQVKMIEWNHIGQSVKTNPLPRPEILPNIVKARRGGINTTVSQVLPHDLFAEGILSDEPVSWYFNSPAMPWVDPAAKQFEKYQYPAKGCPEIHMIWSDTACWLGSWSDGNKNVAAIRSPKIECVITQHPWMENGCLYSDIILPINTKLEEEDIGTDVQNGQYCLIFIEGKCIEPIGESKSDFEAVGEVAKKLGLYSEYTEGKTDEEWMEEGFRNSGVQDNINWEEFKEKGYYVIPTAKDWEKDPVGLAKFAQDPVSNPLETPTGKIEFCSTALTEHFPDDNERPPVPHWIPYGESHQESKLHPRAKEYPLLLVSNHGKWRVHTEHDDISWLREIGMCKVKGPDGYLYEPVWINPQDADARSIENGDIVRIFNERGVVLGGALVTERIMAGVISQDHGARHDPICTNFDRGGSNNLIAPRGLASRNCVSAATSSFLVQLEKVTAEQMEAWLQEYPEVFGRKYDPGSGLVLEAWLEK